MQLAEYKASIKIASKGATLVFLIKSGEILLAMKKRGFGEGKWNGVGGKPKNNESLENAAIRETEEEIGITPKTLEKVAVLNFYFPTPKTDWNEEAVVYLTRDWQGKPSESEEMRPKWFKFKDIPYDEMWWDDKIWLPLVLDGKKIKAEFLFDENEKVKDYKITEIANF